ncbi:substrate-binding periplasmic protein [Hahella sp. NBU794]|uniref:substrate-binding periplasmic protein n=1 Tax=Hahella sp. NBU794 TaxID=3422590 RepID=UPI003D6F2AA6
MAQRVVLFGVLLWMLTQNWSSAQEIAIYARSHTQFDERNEYPVQLLELALQTSGADIKLKSSQDIILQGRAINLIRNNQGVHVLWAMTSKERETELSPIRIPIYKGLIGWRLCIVHPNNIKKFSRIRSLDDLRAITFVQGHDWPDLDIFQHNGLQVESNANYHSMFKMIEMERVDAFPRALIEIWPELETYSSLRAEPHLLIRYPAAVYYFVSRSNPNLYRAIKDGLEKMMTNGEFTRLFNEFYLQAIERARLQERTVIDLENPLLPANTPLNNPRLWYADPLQHSNADNAASANKASAYDGS